MRKITEKDYKKIQRLRDKFYDGVDEYCKTLQDTSTFMDPFEDIMEIIESARSDK
jgi:hypothetical protein